MSRSDPSPQAQDDGVVLAGVKAKPFGWPPASLDAGSGRHQAAAIGGEGSPKIMSLRFQGIAANSPLACGGIVQHFFR
ncbi:hypothetical protein GCM10023152_36710 [Agromyces bauzanensis]